MQRYVFFFVIPNFKPTFFVKKCNFFVSKWNWWESNPRPHNRLIRDYTSFCCFAHCWALGDWPEVYPSMATTWFYDYQENKSYQDVLFLRAWSLGSRLGCDSHCISRRIDVLAVYIFSLFLVYAHCLSLTKRIAVYSVSAPFDKMTSLSHLLPVNSGWRFAILRKSISARGLIGHITFFPTLQALSECYN